MKMNWGRIVNAGLVLEILGIGIYQIFAALHGEANQTDFIFVIVECFVLMLLGALWVGQKIESRFILHGFLVGVVASVYYVIRSLPDALSGQYENYLQWAILGHTPKLLGGIVGGYIAGKCKKTGTGS